MLNTALRAPDLEEAHSSCSDRYPPMPSAGEAEDSEDASTLPSSSIATVCLDATSTDAKHADAKADRFCQHPLPFPLALAKPAPAPPPPPRRMLTLAATSKRSPDGTPRMPTVDAR